MILDIYRSRGINPLAVQCGSLRLNNDANTIGLWDFDEGSGTSLGDKSSGNHSFTLAGTTIPTWGSNTKWVQQLSFGGAGRADNGAAVGSGVASNWTEEAICAPLLTSNVVPANPTPTTYRDRYAGLGYSTTLGPIQQTSTKSIGWGIYSGGIMAMGIMNDWAPIVLSYSCPFTLEEFHYVALVASSDALYLYVDGSLRTVVGSFDTIYMGIGNLGYFTAGGKYWQGKLAGSVRLSNVARSSTEIFQNALRMGFLAS